MLLLLIPAAAIAQDADEPDVEQLQLGQQVYTNTCSGCHQPSGTGLPGQIPPLLNNPVVDDAEFVKGVVKNGLTGEIEVDGVTYNGTMPSFSTLSDEEIDAVIAYLQNDLTVPSTGTETETETGGSTAGSSLPPIVGAMTSFAYLMALAIAAVVFAPRLIARIDRRNVAPLDAYLKAGVIVIYFVVFTVFVPSMVLETEVVGKLPQGVQDFVASGLWIGALAIGVGALWWFQREDRI
ncbi:MAG: cytochrome c [Acidimicrobiia bacterium]|nr:cytochrome c [Acidimicrobiia bacterium]